MSWRRKWRSSGPSKKRRMAQERIMNKCGATRRRATVSSRKIEVSSRKIEVWSRKM